MTNLEKVFEVFRKNYVLVPLEIFGNDPYKSLVSTIMSARTNDDTTLKSSLRLFDKAPNIKTLSQLTEKQIQNLIFPVGFYKTKAKHLKQTALKVLAEFDGKIPSTRESLMSLPGVGRKTANLVLNRAFAVPAIAVDTHVHKITNMLGWVKTKSPEETEKALLKVIPKKLWPETNRLFVSIGRQFKTRDKIYKFLKNEGLIRTK